MSSEDFEGHMNNEGSVSLKEYMDRRFQTMTEAVAVANNAMDIRLEAMNEFRTQILNERQDFLDKKEFESRHALLESQFDRDIDKIALRLNALERELTGRRDRVHLLLEEVQP